MDFLYLTADAHEKRDYIEISLIKRIKTVKNKIFIYYDRDHKCIIMTLDNFVEAANKASTLAQIIVGSAENDVVFKCKNLFVPNLKIVDNSGDV
jgi:hypothetical protein